MIFIICKIKNYQAVTNWCNIHLSDRWYMVNSDFNLSLSIFYKAEKVMFWNNRISFDSNEEILYDYTKIYQKQIISKKCYEL